MKEIYCDKIAYQYTEIPNSEIVSWVRHKIERTGVHKISNDHKKRILNRLIESTQFDGYLKRNFKKESVYACKGIETYISGMGHAIDIAHEQGIKSIVIGSPNRGRLNLQGCIAQKPFNNIFSQFEENDSNISKQNSNFKGDIAIHNGVSNQLRFNDGT